MNTDLYSGDKFGGHTILQTNLWESQHCFLAVIITPINRTDLNALMETDKSHPTEFTNECIHIFQYFAPLDFLQFTIVELGVILLVKLNGAFNAKSHPMCAHILFVLCVSRLVKLTPGTRTSLRCTYKRADTNGLVNE